MKMHDRFHSQGFAVWFTGLSGVGKSTIARNLVEALHRRGISTVELLDGDEVREHLSKELGFSKEDRDTNILRIGYVAHLLARNGVVVIIAAISPYRAIRERVRKQIPNFLEVYVRAPLEVLIQRDVKGLYKRALAGEIKNFTGISDPYEPPLAPEVIVETDRETVDVSVGKVLRALELLGYVAKGEIALPEQEEENVISQLHAVGTLQDDRVPSVGIERNTVIISPQDDAISPHGGVLVNRFVSDVERHRIVDRIERYPSITLTARQWSDVRLIAQGAYSPLKGFVRENEYRSILRHGRLPEGLAWTIPILLLVDEEEAERLSVGNDVVLRDRDGKNLALLHLDEVFRVEKAELAQQVFGTLDRKHPGVKNLYEEGTYALGGDIEVVHLEPLEAYRGYERSPVETREYFRRRGWKSVVAFQTRNPVHRAHEYIQKVALELVDGLLLHPLVGETKEDDIPAAVRMECYRVLLDEYYPRDRVLLSVLPAAMRYAGPKEAIHHAIIRQNYGCTHFIVGRDHAGVGSYYGTYDAHRIFDTYTPDELAIIPLKFEHTFYCTACEGMASAKTCPHNSEHRVVLSGTMVRDYLRQGLELPKEFSRPEVAKVLQRAYAVHDGHLDRSTA